MQRKDVDFGVRGEAITAQSKPMFPRVSNPGFLTKNPDSPKIKNNSTVVKSNTNLS